MRDCWPLTAAAGRVTLHFSGQQILKTVHAEDGVRLSQKNNQNGTGTGGASLSASGGSRSQDIEMTAPVMDFIVKDGRLLERAESSGPPQIVITQPGANQKTVVTAAKFTAKFTEKNRLAALHGEPDAKIVSGLLDATRAGTTTTKTEATKAGLAGTSDRVSTSKMLDEIGRASC